MDLSGSIALNFMAYDCAKWSALFAVVINLIMIW